MQKQKKRAKNWREKKIHSQTSSNDIIDQFSKDQIQRAVDIKNYYRHYSRSKSDACEVNVSDSEIRKLKILYHLEC